MLLLEKNLKMDILNSLKCGDLVTISTGKSPFKDKYIYRINSAIQELQTDKLKIDGKYILFSEIEDIRKMPNIQDVINELESMNTEESRFLVRNLRLTRRYIGN